MQSPLFALAMIPVLQKTSLSPRFTHYSLEGALLLWTPVPLLFFIAGPANLYFGMVSGLASTSFFLAGLPQGFWNPRKHRLFILAWVAQIILVFPLVMENPFAALFASVVWISGCFVILSFQPLPLIKQRAYLGLEKQRLSSALVVFLGLMVLVWYFEKETDWAGKGILLLAWLMLSGVTRFWQTANLRAWATHLLVMGVGLLSVGLLWESPQWLSFILILLAFLHLLVTPDSHWPLGKRWSLEWLFNNPLHLLPVTFALLCLFGSLLLAIPAAAQQSISYLDAAFTAVSAVCVTGLVTLDTPKDFTLFGQASILLLIQLGGLGIMSLTAVALQVLGKRFSLRQERLMTAVTDTSRAELFQTLSLILRFTLIAEGVGTLLLSALLHQAGLAWHEAIWKGLFTAISAFCNAGFALWSESLIPFQRNALILHVVAGLIIMGGLAPSASLMVPQWIKGERVPLAIRLPLIATCFLLVVGTISLLAFEWNGILAGLTIPDKIHNAWFQSATLRTAGFNSVDFSLLSGPGYLVMVVWMIIGGSPGGTAGGIKTAPLGIVAILFWSTITGQNKLVAQKRRLTPELVYRAISIIFAYLLILVISFLMLQITQLHLSAGDLLFEATSALGTVGLSLGITSQLDELGKIIVIATMFAGRVGPLALFMLLSSQPSLTATKYTEAKIPLT